MIQYLVTLLALLGAALMLPFLLLALVVDAALGGGAAGLG